MPNTNTTTTTKTTVKKTAAKPVTAAKVSPAPAKPRVKKAEEVQRLRMRVSAYEHKILDQSVKSIVDTAMRHDAVMRGPIPLPTGIKKYTVNRGAFIDKNSREQFEMRIHRRVVDIVNPSPKVVEALTNLNLPSGVNIDVKMM